MVRGTGDTMQRKGHPMSLPAGSRAPGMSRKARREEDLHRMMQEGLRFHNAGRFAEAKAAYGAVLAKSPSNADALALTGRLLCDMRRHREAVDYLSKAVHADPRNPMPHVQLAVAYHLTDQVEAAVQRIEHAIRLDPEEQSFRLAKSAYLVDAGQEEEALEVAREILAAEPNNAEALFRVARLTRFTGEEPEIATIRALAARTDLSPRDRLSINLALGKVEEDLGNYISSIDAIAAGRAAIPQRFDMEGFRRENAQRKSIFTKAFLDTRRGFGDPTRRPIFIVGMPRSGSTLTEQILSAHPDVAAGGELSAFDNVMTEIVRLAGGVGLLAPFIGIMTPKLTRELASTYLDEIGHYSETAKRITDKALFNFLHLGLIAMLFPNAAIIHCRRNPLDNCVSCFTSPLVDGHAYIRDLHTLGLYYAEYDSVMKHWQDVLPDRIFTVQYENMVEDTESVARAMVDHVGLEWSDACLDFHKSERTVRTVSNAQVRQPIYRTSVDRWKRYGDRLAPLVDALGSRAGDDPGPSS